MTFDPMRLKADLDRVAGMDWTDHFVRDNYDGDWNVLPLRGPAGATHPIKMIFPDPSAESFEDGPAMAQVPYMREILARFACPLQCVRLMRLTPGSVIKPHRDLDLSFELGAARIHVPVATNPDVEFLLAGTAVTMDAGSVWYLRLSETHSVANRGNCDRVHLVIDAVANDWLEHLLKRAADGNSQVSAA